MVGGGILGGVAGVINEQDNASTESGINNFKNIREPSRSKGLTKERNQRGWFRSFASQ